MPRLPRIFDREFKFGVHHVEKLPAPFEGTIVRPKLTVSLHFRPTKWLLGVEWWLNSWDPGFGATGRDPEIVVNAHLPTLCLGVVSVGPLARAWQRRALRQKAERDFRFQHDLWRRYGHGEEPRCEDYDYVAWLRRDPEQVRGSGAV